MNIILNSPAAKRAYKEITNFLDTLIVDQAISKFSDIPEWHMQSIAAQWIIVDDLSLECLEEDDFALTFIHMLKGGTQERKLEFCDDIIKKAVKYYQDRTTLLFEELLSEHDNSPRLEMTWSYKSDRPIEIPVRSTNDHSWGDAA